MPTTIAGLAELVAREVGEEYADLDVGEQFNAWALDVCREFLLETDWPWSQDTTSLTTVANTVEYELSSPFGRLKALHQTSPRTWGPLRQTSRDALANAGHDLSLTGEPSAWYPAGLGANGRQTIGLYPIPNGVYVYDGEVVVDGELLTSASSIPFPEAVASTVKHALRARYLESIGAEQNAASADTRYRIELIKVRRRYAAPQSSLPYAFESSDVPRGVVLAGARPDFPIVES